MRKIKFKLNTQTNLEVIETNARTFGELKAEMSKHSVLGTVNFGNSQLIERDTKVMYGAIDDAILPAVDCIMFVTPVKTNSGCDVPSEADLLEMGYMELRSLGSKLNKEANAGINLQGKRYDILERILGYRASLNEVELTLVDEAYYHLNELKSIIAELSKVTKTPEEPTAIKVTLSQLEEEAKQLAELFKK